MVTAEEHRADKQGNPGDTEGAPEKPGNDRFRAYWKHAKKPKIAQLRDPPWERQPGESGKAYQAFTIYRELGPARSHRAVAGRLGKSRPLVDRWAIQWRWAERAAAWDQEVERRRQAAYFSEITEMARRHVQQALALQAKALQRLRDLDVGELSPVAALRFIMEGVKLERLVRGAPTENVATDSTVRYTIEPADLMRMIQIILESQGGGGPQAGPHRGCGADGCDATS